MYEELNPAGAKHKSPFKRYWMRHSFSIISYFGLAVIILCIYHLFSDGDFSVLMTLGSLFSLFSFVLLGVKAFVTKRVTLISLKTLECYAVVFIARLCSILFYEGYLPYDKSGDYVYQACEVLSLVLVAALIGIVAIVYRRSYGHAEDSFGANIVPHSLGALTLVIPSLAIACVLHPSLNNNWATDTAWAFALYLEAVAIVPQLYMFGVTNKQVEPLEANFVFTIAIGRLMHFIFWLSSYHELNDKYTTHFGKKYPGHLVVFSQIVNLLLMGEHCFNYLSASRRGEDLLPTRTGSSRGSLG